MMDATTSLPHAGPKISYSITLCCICHFWFNLWTIFIWIKQQTNYNKKKNELNLIASLCTVHHHYPHHSQRCRWLWLPYAYTLLLFLPLRLQLTMWLIVFVMLCSLFNCTLYIRLILCLFLPLHEIECAVVPSSGHWRLHAIAQILFEIILLIRIFSALVDANGK